MKSEILIRDGELVSIEVAMNGRRKLDIRFWNPETDETIWVDRADIVAASQRERLIRQLPPERQVEGAAHLMSLANDVAARRQQRVTPASPDGTANLQTQPLEEAPETTAVRQAMAHTPRLLERFAEDLARLGVVGEDRTAKLIFLAVTSRLLERPVSVAVKGPSAGGKSFTVEQTLRFFPSSAYYALTAMSERALAYSEEPLTHRMLVIYEAAGLTGDFASYLVRSLLSEGRLSYETVEKTDAGMKARRIEREGPTGLLVTTTAVSLHPENETRLLSVTVTDTPEQTKRILLDIAIGVRPALDLSAWHSLQRWLERADHRIAVPYASAVARLIPPVAVRLRRDFSMVLNLVRAHALLHQANRQRDAGGYVVATHEDYVVVHSLVVDLLAEAVGATVPKSIRETVAAVKTLSRGDRDAVVTATAVAGELKLDTSAAWRRVQSAVAKGYLKNLETTPRRSARLVLGDPLPEEMVVLPNPETVEEACRFAASVEKVGDETTAGLLVPEGCDMGGPRGGLRGARP
jgi:hypothetical protein